MKYRSIVNLVALLCIAASAATFGLTYYQSKMISHDLTTHTFAAADILKPAPMVQPFQLTDINGKPFTQRNLQGQWTFLFFGFTNCPQLCPTTMTNLNKMYSALAPNHPLTNTQVMFVSIDPERDTLSRIKQYVTSFNKNFSGATGTQQQITDITKQFGVVYMKTANDGTNDASTNYGFDHSGVILLVNPKGELQAMFALPHDPVKIAKDFTTITQYYS